MRRVISLCQIPDQRRGMYRLHIIIIALMTSFLASEARAADRPQHNFLIIVDSSISMAPHKETAIKWLKEIVAKRFDGQIEPGDSIDVWTYDTESNLRGFPPQIWQPAQATKIADEAATYLENYRFKGRSDFKRVAEDLAMLVPHTKNLLIVVITDGEEPFSGFSLDLEVNGYLSNRNKLGPSKGPLMISLAAIDGALRTWTAYFGEGVVDLATLPSRGEKDRVVTQRQSKKQEKPTPQQLARVPVPKQPEPVLIPTSQPGAKSQSVFNFPPGTRITPIQLPSNPDGTPQEQPLESKHLNTQLTQSVTEQETVTRPATPTSIAQTSVVTDKLPENNAAVIVPKPAPVSPVSSHGATTQPKPVQAKTQILPHTNASPVVDTDKQTNINAVAGIRPPASSNSSAHAANLQGTARNNMARGKVVPSATAATSMPPQSTVRNATYGAGIMGAGCIFLGAFVLFRKLRRPSQSIISRSLLQR